MRTIREEWGQLQHSPHLLRRQEQINGRLFTFNKRTCLLQIFNLLFYRTLDNISKFNCSYLDLKIHEYITWNTSRSFLLLQLIVCRIAGILDINTVEHRVTGSTSSRHLGNIHQRKPPLPAQNMSPGPVYCSYRTCCGGGGGDFHFCPSLIFDLVDMQLIWLFRYQWTAFTQ